ncbi:prenyltransferase [Nitrincola sp. MINF-07-Sa-05]|uniref:prenyltransferase n=1 Tax=Nitrincola salilacus TaxID=3400273 RepID=UPI00391811B4
MKADLSRYRFQRALRPFSFPVAMIACLTGVALAWADGAVIDGAFPERVWQPLQILLILLGGVLAQAGVNLINDYADIHLIRRQPGPEAERIVKAIRFNFVCGMLCFLFAALIALYLITLTGLELLLICLLGLAGALGYTLSPVNYKNRGLGVVMVFWLMGVLMISGSHLAAGGELSWQVFWQTIPVSLLVSALLLSNELRDFESDREQGLQTLTVRAGFERGCRLYQLLLLLVWLCVGLFWFVGLLPYAWVLLPALILLIRPLGLLRTSRLERGRLPPTTARALMGFGVLYCLALILPSFSI